MSKTLNVDSSPTKEFFIRMITKDVTIDSAILDLIDNSIDAFKKNNLENANIHINFNIEHNYFEIIDDCGGMDKVTAENYAFKFGNEKEREKYSVGMYGIGMKRSIFKIGQNFEVSSKTKTDSFVVSSNIEE